MHIRTEINDEFTHLTSENVVQKIFEATDACQNENCNSVILNDKSSEIMCIKVSNSRDLHKYHSEWSLCSIDKFIKYLFVNWFLLSYGKRIHFIISKCFHHCYGQKQQPSLHQEHTRTLFYGVQQLVTENNHHHRMEQSHEILTIDKSFILYLLLHSRTHQLFKSAIFYTKLYKVLLNLFYEHFNSKSSNWHHCHNCHQSNKICLNPKRSFINMICDLSTNRTTSCDSRNILFILNEIRGFEHHQQYHRCLVSTLNFLFGFSLIQRHEAFNDSYEFSDNHNVNCSVTQFLLLQLLAPIQMVTLSMSATWHHFHHQMKIQMPDGKSCHEIENGISTLATTSNHKLKATTQNDNDTCHHESEIFSNCYQQFHRTFRCNDSVKSHLNAILFLIILCIPLLTAASSVHNLKYSANVVKTKYGPIRGIILRSNPTVEGYFGVPYGESLMMDKLFHLP